MKLIIYLVIFILPLLNVQAGEFFDFRPAKNYGSNGEIIKVTFGYKLQGYSQEDFLVKPVLSKGKVEIFNRQKYSWVAADSLWMDFPSLEEEMEIRFYLEGEGRLHFLLQNTRDAAIYQTPGKVIWGGNLLSGYTQKVNEGIFRYKLRQDEARNAASVTSDTLSDQGLGERTGKGASLIGKVIKYFNEIF